MKILHINSTDITGGAARAAYRIHQSLRKMNVSSKVLCQNRKSDDRDIIGPRTSLAKAAAVFRGFWDRSLVSFYLRRPRTLFYPQWLPGSTLSSIERMDPDIVHLHWICGGFVRIETLGKIKRPVIWTLHDMWAFTGGCHYSGTCENYKTNCGCCPQLGSQKSHDLSRWVWNRKKKAFSKNNLTVIAPSKWLAGCARKSGLMRDMRIEVIPYCLDLKKYYPIDQKNARKFFNLPQDAFLVLIAHMGSEAESRKGWDYLHATFQLLSKKPISNKIEIVVLGCSEPEHLPNYGVKANYIGQLFDDISIALLYSACDCFAFSSTEDNLPNMVLESMSCGTPCIAFNIGGVPDMIEHKNNGFLAKPFDVNDLVKGIAWVLEDKNRLRTLSKNARNKVEEEFDPILIGHKYLKLYKELMDISTFNAKS
jgi:glycosyltransferase involved in cell wall biosynthesis